LLFYPCTLYSFCHYTAFSWGRMDSTLWG